MAQVAAHSNLVGGSTASRVIGCPGSVALVAKMPPRPSSEYADKGTLLHDTISDILSFPNLKPEDYLGRRHQDITLTQDLIDDKLRPALDALNEIDSAQEMELEVESRVSFGDLIPGAFGSVDVIGRLGNRTIVLDWKFGDGVAVSAIENKQLLFYAAAARRTVSTQWAFKNTNELELIIVQPPAIKRWATDFKTLDRFEADLLRAVKLAQQPNAPIEAGDHCRWCAAKPICPAMTGAVERAAKTALKNIDAAQLGAMLQQADLIEDWIKDLRELAFEMLENDVKVPGYKLVPKRAVRQWVDEKEAAHWLDGKGLEPKQIFEQKIISPAQAEKVLKKSKTVLPNDMVVAVSSGHTLAPESDPRPAVLNIGRQLTAALSKI